MRNVIIAVLVILTIGLWIAIDSNNKEASGIPKITEGYPKKDVVNTSYATPEVVSRPIDSASIKALKPKFVAKKDEFENVEWIRPKNSPQYVNYNGIYLYFAKQNGKVSNLRFQIQYNADDWLFIKKYQFVIDDVAFTYIPNDMSTDNGDGEIWEWSDDKVDYSNMDIVKALSTAKSAKIKFVGTDYHKVKPITAAQLKAIKETLEYYEALGGSL